VDALERYWAVFPNLRKSLFKKNRPGYVTLAIEKTAIKSAIFDHYEFTTFIAGMNAHFDAWKATIGSDVGASQDQKALAIHEGSHPTLSSDKIKELRKYIVESSAKSLKALKAGCHPKQIIGELSEELLKHYHNKPLIDAYDVYQHLMDYWAETMQDDCYLIAAEKRSGEATLSSDGQVLGTPAYMPPEFAAGEAVQAGLPLVVDLPLALDEGGPLIPPILADADGQDQEPVVLRVFGPELAERSERHSARAGVVQLPEDNQHHLPLQVVRERHPVAVRVEGHDLGRGVADLRRVGRPGAGEASSLVLSRHEILNPHPRCLSRTDGLGP